MYKPSTFIRSIFGAVLLLCCLQNSSSTLLAGYEIIDLNWTGAAFIQDANSWSATRLVSNTIVSYNCAGVDLLGGYMVLGALGTGQRNDYFQRVYTNLPPHNMIRFTFGFWAIDSWDPGSNDGFFITFDTTVVDGLHIPFAYHTEDLCGIRNANDWKELKNIRVRGNVPHSGNTVTFRVNSYLDEDTNNESFGFRDINLAFVTTSNITSPSLCGSAATSFPKGQCTCPEGQYYNGAKCTDCHASCSSCSGPNPTDCFACKKPGNGWDGQKCVACSSGCYTCNGLSPSVCLPCEAGQVYYPETGQCADYCDFPLSLTTTAYGKTCLFPCASNQYVSANQTCVTSCPAPSQIVMVNSYYKLCLD